MGLSKWKDCIRNATKDVSRLFLLPLLGELALSVTSSRMLLKIAHTKANGLGKPQGISHHSMWPSSPLQMPKEISGIRRLIPKDVSTLERCSLVKIQALCTNSFFAPFHQRNPSCGQPSNAIFDNVSHSTWQPCNENNIVAPQLLSDNWHTDVQSPSPSYLLGSWPWYPSIPQRSTCVSSTMTLG
jgi:hypothetical protein